MKRDYFPGIATIAKNIVYLENRNGNSNVKFKQEETLARAYEMLNSNAIKLNHYGLKVHRFGWQTESLQGCSTYLLATN